MIYVKSLLAGVVALFVATVLYVYIYFFFWIRPTLPQVPPGTSVGIDIRSFLRGPSFWLIPLLAFAIAFYWESRRAAR